jgi:hypothetical protein
MSKRWSLARNAGGPDGDIRSTPRKTIPTNGKPQGTGQGNHAEQEFKADLEPDPTIAETLAQLLTHTDGWARLIPDTEHKTLFLKWKWSKGKHQGKYVMSVVPPWQLALGLEILLGKVEDAEAGRIKPTVDKAYDA